MSIEVTPVFFLSVTAALILLVCIGRCPEFKLTWMLGWVWITRYPATLSLGLQWKSPPLTAWEHRRGVTPRRTTLPSPGLLPPAPLLTPNSDSPSNFLGPRWPSLLLSWRPPLQPKWPSSRHLQNPPCRPQSPWSLSFPALCSYAFYTHLCCLASHVVISPSVSSLKAGFVSSSWYLYPQHLSQCLAFVWYPLKIYRWQT